MRTWTPLFATALVVAAAAPAHAVDSNLFPAAPAAAKASSFDQHRFLIDGKPTFIASGSLHYARVPRALWRERLLAMKRAGANTVETYAFWNFHEPQKGRFDFSGDKNLGAFLDLAKEVGLYAVVRVGPYVCAEWDSGGFPVWLRFEPDLAVRVENPAFEKYAHRWYDQVLPIVAKRQHHRGGAVILVQLENEHPLGWGTDLPNGYFKRLRDKALALGLEVPHFMSGLHHSHDPAGETPFDYAARKTPWYSTEFWTGWFDLYGAMPAALEAEYTRAAWKMIAFGAAGFNAYMFHGGSDFATWNDNDMAASYDYAAPLGQAGDTRPFYFQWKRATLFARSFAPALAGAVRTDAPLIGVKLDPKLRSFVWKAGDTTLAFLDNPSKAAVTAPDVEGKPLELGAGELVPVLRGVPLVGRITGSVASRVLGLARYGDTATLVLYGAPGQRAFARLTSAGKELVVDELAPKDGQLIERLWDGEGGHVRVLVLSTGDADRTYFVDGAGGTSVVVGLPMVTESSERGGRIEVRGEAPLDGKAPIAAVAFVGSRRQALTVTTDGPGANLRAPALSAWRARHADSEAAPGFDDHTWLTSATPRPQGADGDFGAYAWYRTNLEVPSAGTYQVVFEDLHDWAALFVDGKRAGATKADKSPLTLPRLVSIDVPAGKHTFAALTAHYGRPKLFNVLGPIANVEVKGINGAVTLRRNGRERREKLATWTMAPATNAAAEVDAATAGKLAGFRPAVIGHDVFDRKPGFMWFRTTLEGASLPGEAHRGVKFPPIDDHATVYLNGKRLHYEPDVTAFYVDVDAAYRPSGPNVLLVLVEDAQGKGGFLNGVPELVTFARGETVAGAHLGDGWRLRGGIGEPDDKRARWTEARPDGERLPTFYRSQFTLPASWTRAAVRVLRVGVAGLSRGFVWVNGHNLGRYPETIKVPGLYIPEPWLVTGKNDIVVFDEDGASPRQVQLVLERAASRVKLVAR